MSGRALILPAAIREESAPDASAPAAGAVRWRWQTMALAAMAVALAVVAVWVFLNRPPGDGSVEAGFARDMIVHHDQAVTMALLIRDRTDDPAIEALATDILLTQQNQIGQMLGWLNAWELPATGRELPMTWMGHPTDGLMPGMASPEELDRLASLSGAAADREFLRLMIRHHAGGLPMAEAAVAQSRSQPVRDLARAIVTTQEREIANMEDLLRSR